MKTFEDFALNKQITKALDLANFIKPTPIQNKIIPLINERIDIKVEQIINKENNV